MRALTISELERESGVPRRTIYYYVRLGLLPEAQKASRTRALYTEDHLALLRDIEALRAEGLRPAAIRTRLAGRLKAAGENGVDLVARRDEETRDAILRAATRSFARKGYKGTRMADLVAELGITPQLLYQHFATKRDLFVACYRIAVHYMAGVIIPRVGPEGDPAARLVWYMYADEGIKAFAPHMFALAVEASQHDEEARRDMREAYERIFRELIDDLGAAPHLRPGAADLGRAHQPRPHGRVPADARARRPRRRVLVARGDAAHARALPPAALGLPRRAGPGRAAGARTRTCSPRSPSCRRRSRRSSKTRERATRAAAASGIR